MEELSHLKAIKIRVENFSEQKKKILLFKSNKENEQSVYLESPDDNAKENFSDEAYARLLIDLSANPLKVERINIWGNELRRYIDLYQLYVRDSQKNSLTVLDVYYDPYQMQCDVIQIKYDFEIGPDTEIEFYAPPNSKSVFTFMCYY